MPDLHRSVIPVDLAFIGTAAPCCAPPGRWSPECCPGAARSVVDGAIELTGGQHWRAQSRPGLSWI